MIRLVCTCEFSGEAFSPEKVSQVTGLIFVRANEPGDIGKLGRYRGLPTPYGSASMEVPATIAEGGEILWLARRLLPHMELLRDAGATDIHLSIGLFHDGQCNWSLSAEEFAAVSALGLYMNISAYEDTSLKN